MKASDLRLFMKEIPNEAEVIFSDGIITFMFGDNTLAFNKCGGQWDNGVGYAPGGTACCLSRVDTSCAQAVQLG